MPGLTDYMIWPFVERAQIAIELLGRQDSSEFLEKEMPTIADYIKQLRADPTVQEVSLDYEVLRNFNLAYLKKLQNQN